MKTLREYIKEAHQHHVGIGHFNFGTMTMLRGILKAAQEASDELDHPFVDGKIPIIVGVSEGDREIFGEIEAVSLVKMMREVYEYPIFIDADHTHGKESLDPVFRVIDLGYDMVIYDGIKEGYETNLKKTNEVVVYKNDVNPECIIEAELGFISSGSDLKDSLPEGIGPEAMTDPAEAKKFVETTGIDALAPSVGNVHGMIKSGNPALDHTRIAEVAEATGVPLVLHGGSGVSDEDFVKAIKAGIRIIHLSTEIRKIYRETLEQQLASDPSVSPTHYLPACEDAVKELVKGRIALFLS
ncbi:class II fructose-bisphosphate aldolase [Candidatus Nomurabacteria bacterium]|nr:class II fructose-bisphosphate aldolase [Candidatus Nomurabacteria bacterium]